MSDDLIVVEFDLEVELRSADHDDDHHYVGGYIMPWDQETDRGMYVERFQRGALRKTLSEQSVNLYATHEGRRSGLPVGVLVRHEERDFGHWAEFKLLNTQGGRETYELLKERAFTGFSVGFLPVRTKRNRVENRDVLIRQEVRLDHVAALHNPAYTNAKVLALREDSVDEKPAPALVVAEARRRLRERELKHRSF